MEKSTKTMSPQIEYTSAINFDDTSDHQTSPYHPNNQQRTQSKMKQMMANVLKIKNESKYVYPSIAIIVTSIFVILLLFQKVCIGVKIFAVIILLLFIAFTIYEFKR
ncbi:GrBNV gp51-like protein-like protein [Mauternbach virus]|uniref:GrBNV gp51-like protein-like protein n=1 Tax=Mauternbach virus TaxID=2486603 RepID=A0A3G3E851_9VIRU|nr:GrBNV gp51-like protein-like protein [Mauternbach virus]AYP97978.1 GrBNV gp51-like protein-like protein [Mauternbach virus]